MNVTIDGFSQFDFANNGIEHTVYRKGSGPGVLVMHELPGLTPQCIELANRIASEGFSVYLPLLFGEPNATAMVADTLRVCVSQEFKCFALNESSPITVWLRALGRKMYADLDGSGIGVIGLCLTGGFVLSLMADAQVLAPVTSEPALPFMDLTDAGQRALGVSDEELNAAVNNGRQLLGFRFSGDWICPAKRFDTLQARFGSRVLRTDIESSPGNVAGIRPHAHAVLTEDYNNTPGHPTRLAFEKVVVFLKQNLPNTAIPPSST
jgi:dienelactone hydrolase